MLNQRRAAILRRLLADVQPWPTVAVLALEHGVSERLIRYDLAAIGEWLNPRGGQLRSDQQNGFGVAGELQRLQAELTEAPTLLEYALSPEERRLRIIEALLPAPRFITVPSLAERLQVSRGTIYADLEGIEAWLLGFGLTLEKRTRAGVRITGHELGWRGAACSFLAEQVGPDRLIRWVLEGGRSTVDDPETTAVIASDEIKSGMKAIRKAEAAAGLHLSDASFADLALYLAVTIHRLREGKQIPVSPGVEALLIQTREWQIAGFLLADIGGIWNLTSTPGEQVALTQHLQQAGERLEGHDRAATADDTSLRLAGMFVRQAGSLVGLDLQQDPGLVPGLALHLRPVPYRLQQYPPLENPMLAQIREMFPALYQAARSASAILTAAWGEPVPEAEIGYLTMHLGAALERIRSRPAPRIRALVVCGTGVGTARMLASRLAASVPDLELAGITSVLGMEGLLASAAFDLVIATCRVPNAPVPVVQVSPLLPAQDLQSVRKALETALPADPTTRKANLPMLTEILTPATIRLDVEVATWEEAVRAAGAVLTAAGVADAAYGEAMINTVRQIGPYIVIAPGIAMPHARPSDGTHRLGFAMLRLKHPVRFGHETNDPVDLVFALAAVDPESHLKALSQLSVLLSDDDGVARLRSAPDTAAVMEILAVATE